MDMIAHDVPLQNAEFSPDFNRLEIAELILNRSIDIKQICLYCVDNKNESTYLCKKCNRWADETTCALRVLQECMCVNEIDSLIA